MSFRCRQKLIVPMGYSAYEPEEVTLPSGVIETELVDQCSKVMPDPALFDLSAQLKAGVQLEEVNSKVLTAKNIDAAKVVRKYTRKNSKSNSNEVNNEG